MTATSKAARVVVRGCDVLLGPNKFSYLEEWSRRVFFTPSRQELGRFPQNLPSIKRVGVSVARLMRVFLALVRAHEKLQTVTHPPQQQPCQKQTRYQSFAVSIKTNTETLS
jgi:hypothetical protein